MALMNNCCLCVSARTGTIMIATFYITLSLMFLISMGGIHLLTTSAEFAGATNTTVALNFSKPVLDTLIAGIVIMSIYMVLCFLLIIGVDKGTPCLMLLWIVVEFLRQLFCLIVFVIFAIYLKGPLLTPYIVLGIFGLLFALYLWLCVISARQLIIEKSRTDPIRVKA